MNPHELGADRRAILLYRGTCPKCRFLSRLAVALSAGTLRRIPIDSDAATALYRRIPQSDGRLALFSASGVTTGWRVVPAGVRVLLSAWRSALHRLTT